MISDVKIDDSQEFYFLGRMVNDKFDSLYNLNNLLDSKYDFIFGYYVDNKLVGFIHVVKLYENLEIINIVVDCSYRRKGIGYNLLMYAISYFVDLQSVFLEVRESNVNAISLYDKAGFSVISKRDKYYGNEDALIMKRDVLNERC